LESNWGWWVWEYGLTNLRQHRSYSLVAPWLTHPGLFVCNGNDGGIITPSSVVALPGTVLPDNYVFFNNPGTARPFPYGLAVPPD